MTRGVRVATIPFPHKEDIADQLRSAVGLDPAVRSGGSTVRAATLDDVYRAWFGSENPGADAYRKAEHLLTRAGLTYDPRYDSSEQAATGGSTVTIRTYSRLLVARTGVPRCFLLPEPDEADRTGRVDYAEGHTDFNVLRQAGPGSRVVLYRDTTESLEAVGVAGIAQVGGEWRTSGGPVFFQERRVLGAPVRMDVRPALRGNEPSVREISFETFQEIAKAGAAALASFARDPDPGGDVIAEQVVEDDYDVDIEPLHVPDLPQGEQSFEVPDGTWEEGADSSPVAMTRRTPSQRRKDRLAEQRAVVIATRSLKAAGWRLTRDRQADGVGYDLEFEKDGKELHVEVKGVQAAGVAFNMTPKERWRAETDPRFVVAVVTNVFSPARPQLQLLTRASLADARWITTGYRLTFGQ